MRVALRRVLWLEFGENGLPHYKFIIASMLATFLQQTLGRGDIEQVSFLVTKLARRVAKLEVQRQDNHNPCTKLTTDLLGATESSFMSELQQARTRIERAWETWKSNNRRHVEPFRTVRALQQFWTLRLHNSFTKLRCILDSHASIQYVPSRHAEAPTKIPLIAWTSTYRSLSDKQRTFLHRDNSLQSDMVKLGNGTPTKACTKLASNIRDLVTALVIQDQAGGHAGLLSTSLLTILEMWVEMDKVALLLFPLLNEYHPGIPDDILDTLQLHTWLDMQRLQRVHLYIRDRAHRCTARHLSIFGRIGPMSFASRSFDASLDMQQRLEQIEEIAEQRADAKIVEWEEKTAEYHDLEKQLAEHPNCTTVAQGEPPFDIVHDDKRCTKCYLERCKWRLRIGVCEHPLPKDVDQTKAVIFELYVDQAFCAYRDSTWMILGRLAYLSFESNPRKPLLSLKDYPGLKDQTLHYAPRSFGLASMKKAFEKTHYRSLSLPVDAEKLRVPWV